ncbi:hypothetical protein K0U83_03670, partial [bacterium]|nr:hypothetical protein [bacterium]
MAALSYWEKSRIHQFLQAIGSYVKSVSEGTGASVDNTDPQNPIVSARISTDPSNAIILGTDDGLYAVSGGSSGHSPGCVFSNVLAATTVTSE